MKSGEIWIAPVSQGGDFRVLRSFDFGAHFPLYILYSASRYTDRTLSDLDLAQRGSGLGSVYV